MADQDDSNNSLIVLTPNQDNSLEPQQGLSTSSQQVYPVKIKVVKGVLDYDFPQAKKTWEALVEAGIEPAELVANALETGHSYKSEERELISQFENPRNPSLMYENKVSEDYLVGYNYQRLNRTPKNLLISGDNNQSLILSSSELVISEPESGEIEVVKMTAVLRSNTPQIPSADLSNLAIDSVGQEKE